MAAEKINILFRDGSRMEFNHSQSFNCDENANSYFAGGFGRRGILDQIVAKEIETIRVFYPGRICARGSHNTAIARFYVRRSMYARLDKVNY